jgi:1,4-alpha-glucan branching enzyme
VAAINRSSGLRHRGAGIAIIPARRERESASTTSGGTTGGLRGHHLVFHINEDENVIAFQRWAEHGPGDDVVVVANFGYQAKEAYRIGMPCAGTWSLRFNSDAFVYSEAFDGPHAGDLEALAEPHDGLEASVSVAVGAYSLLIYSQKPD